MIPKKAPLLSGYEHLLSKPTDSFRSDNGSEEEPVFSNRVTNLETFELQYLQLPEKSMMDIVLDHFGALRLFLIPYLQGKELFWLCFACKQLYEMVLSSG